MAKVTHKTFELVGQSMIGFQKPVASQVKNISSHNGIEFSEYLRIANNV